MVRIGTTTTTVLLVLVPVPAAAAAAAAVVMVGGTTVPVPAGTWYQYLVHTCTGPDKGELHTFFILTGYQVQYCCWHQRWRITFYF